MNKFIQSDAAVLPRRPNPLFGRRSLNALIILGGMLSTLLAAYLIVQGRAIIVVAAIFLVPLLLLLYAQPFVGVMIWLVVMPFVSVLPSADLAYWAVYRLLPPTLLCLVVISRTLKVRAHSPVSLGPPELAMGVLAIFVPGLILFLQTDPSLALIRFADRVLLPFCLYLVARLSAPHIKEFLQLRWVALFLALSQSLIGFLSWYAPHILPKAWQYLHGQRTTGSFRDPDLYAFVMVLSAVILIHSGINHKSSLFRWFSFVTAGVCAIFAFLSLERAAWLGGVLVTIGLICLYPKVMLRLLIIGALVMAVLGTGILSSHLALSVDRFGDSDPVYDRLVVFDAMMQMAEMKPILGWGYETLDQNIQHYYRQVNNAYISSRLVTSHNTYMTILTELGLAGFLLYMFPVAWWFILSLRVWQRMAKKGFWSRSLLGILWLMMLFNFTVSNFMDMRWFPIGVTLWWLVLGLIANMVYPYLKNRSMPAPALAQKSLS